MIIVHLLIILVFSQICLSQISVTDNGVVEPEENDMALIVFITLKNTCKENIDINVRMVECKDPSENGRALYLIGGDMGTLRSKNIRNVTLLFPTMYFKGISATCTIAIKYQSENKANELKTDIKIKSNTVRKKDEENTSNEQMACKTEDLDPEEDCNPVDCMIKYDGERNFYSNSSNLCLPVPFCVSSQCDPDIVYQVNSNACRKMNTYVSKADLQKLESNEVHVCSCTFAVNAICHHGNVNKETGVCECLDDWTTSPDPDDVYQPSSQQYHICNVEVNSWNSVNKSKVETTILLICIFAITIASKLVILMCLLTWCIKMIKSPFNKKKDDEESMLKTCLCKPPPACPCNSSNHVLTEEPKSKSDGECCYEKPSESSKSSESNFHFSCEKCKENNCKCNLCDHIDKLIDKIIDNSDGYACSICKEKSCTCKSCKHVKSSSTSKKSPTRTGSKSSKTSGNTKDVYSATCCSKKEHAFEDYESDFEEDFEEEEEDEDYEIEFSEGQSDEEEEEEEEEEDGQDNQLSQIKEDDEDEKMEEEKRS